MGLTESVCGGGGGGGGGGWSRCSLRHMSAHLNSGGLAESTVEHD